MQIHAFAAVVVKIDYTAIEGGAGEVSTPGLMSSRIGTFQGCASKLE